MSESGEGPGGGGLDPGERRRLGAHFYRDEMRRTVAWRARLDTTSNWAVVLAASILTFAFSSEDNPHYLLLVAMGGVVAFTIIEARRYRHYDVWRCRIRLLEEHFFSRVFDGEGSDDGEWSRRMAADLRRPTYKISLVRAVHHRLRRFYLALLLILVVTWVARITVFSDGEFDIARDAAVGEIPGTWVAWGVGLLVAVAVALTVWPFDGRGRLQPKSDDGAEAGWE